MKLLEATKRKKRRNEPKAWSLQPPKSMYSSSSSSSSSSSPQQPLDLQHKAEAINLLLCQPEVDLWKLREFCLTEGGLVNDTLRKRAWPKLVGLSPYSNPNHESNQQHHHHTNGANGTNANKNGEQQHRANGNGNGNTNSNNISSIEERSLEDESLPPTPMKRPSGKTITPVQDEGPQFEIDASAVLEQEQKDDHMSSSECKNGDGGSPIKGACHPFQPEVLFPLHVPACVDSEQIERDVARCTWHLLTGSQRSRRLQHENKHRKKVATLLKKKQRRLANLINLTMSGEPDLRYYQGYHDVACIFLHALGSDGSDGDPLGVDLPARVLAQVSLFHLRDSCSTSFSSLQQCLHWTIFPLLAKLDPQLHNHLKDCDMEPFFCLSWIITWFSHDVRDTNLVKRLFDAFLVSHPLLVLYVSIAMMIHPFNRKIILDTDCDFAALHHTLSMLPRHSSRVGWKKARQGGGYISADIIESDDEEEDDDDEETGVDDSTTRTDNERWDDSVAASDEVFGQSHGTSTTTGSTLTPTPSMNGSALVIGDRHGTTQRDDQERVPFQLLIETALGYMQHYPPTCLLELASWYYQQELLDAASPTEHNIRMLQPSPKWAITPQTTADWVDKQRIRQAMGLTKTSRKDRRRKRLLAAHGVDSKGEILSLNDASPCVLSMEEYLRRHKRTMAVVASGQGPYGAKEQELYQKRMKLALRGAVVVGVSAIFIGALHQYSSDRTNSLPSSSANNLVPPPPQAKELDVIPNADATCSRPEESLVEMRVLPDSTAKETCDLNSKEKLVVDVAKSDSKSTDSKPHRAITSSTTAVSAKSIVAVTTTASKYRIGGGDGVGSNKPVLPDTLTPAQLFPSRSNQTNNHNEASSSSSSQQAKGQQLLLKKWNEEVKKITMAVYRYFYRWTSKLILKPILFLKNFWNELPLRKKLE